jgi:hypothetical protein
MSKMSRSLVPKILDILIMDYKKLYDSIVERAKIELRNKTKEGTYYESHHIIPKCLGGTGETTQWRTHPNLVLLTAKEHYLCHRLLCRMYPNSNQLAYAFWAMCNQSSKKQSRYKPSTTSYEEARTQFSKFKKETASPLRGRKLSKETKEKMSRSKLGIKRPKEVGQLMSLRQMGSKLSEEVRKKISNTSKGHKKPEGHGVKIGISNSKLKSKGLYITPNGSYTNALEAGIANNCSESTIYNRCKNQNFIEYKLIEKSKM